jgi:tetratricopeptide (TPR) repeat protein
VTGHRHWSFDDLCTLRVRDAKASPDDVVGGCFTCRDRLVEVDRFLAALADPVTWEETRGGVKKHGSLDVSRLRATASRHEENLANAEEQMRQLRAHPYDEWHARLAGFAPNDALPRKLIDEAIGLLDTAVSDALYVLACAEAATRALPLSRAADYRAEIWKNRANAFRMLGEYASALRATRHAARYTALFSTGRWMLGQIIYTRATIIFKMGSYRDARRLADDAISLLSEFGDKLRIAHASTLKAAALTEEGRLDDAIATYRALRRTLLDLGDADGVARVTESLAVTCLRRGDLTDARRYAVEAVDRFAEIGSRAEEIRMRWVLGSLRMREGDREGAIEYMQVAIAEFESLQMHGDAALVRLEITEELLSRGRWDEAEALAREAAATFAKNDARPHVAAALAYLRECVARREATPDLIAQLRTYIDAGDPALPFVSREL